VLELIDQALLAVHGPGVAKPDELLARTGMSPGSLRRHLGRLQQAGYLSRVADRSGGPGRPRIAYLPTPM